MKKQRFATRVIHAGQKPEPVTGAVIPPIFATSTYTQKSPGEHTGYEYSRTQNPTREAYERMMADLETGEKAYAFASGMAATATILELIDSGDHVIACDDMYGGTYRLFENVRKRSSGLDFSFVDMSMIENVEKNIKSTTQLIWVETPSNPLLKLVDIRAITQLAKRNHCLTVVDNTFATPCCQRPLELGVDIVMHSVTKYINGHSDVIGGVVVLGENEELQEQFAFLQNSIGSVPSPFDCFLTLRGLKTLNLRMQAHCDNALALAKWLETHSQIEKVLYPGLENHPQYKLAKQQMHGFGGVISVIVKGGLQKAIKVLENCHLFTLAESLGGVESLIEHPAIMTHASIPKDIREKIGIADGLLRLSVGIEALEDLQDDLDWALKE